jgi:Tfp pilus assembly protein PilO
MRVQNPRLRELFKTPKRKTYTLAGVTALIVGLFALLTLRPTFKKIADLNSEIDNKEKFLEKVDEKLGNLTYLIEQKELVTDELAYLEEDLPTTTESGFLVANLSEAAKKRDIVFLSVEFEEEDEESQSLDIENAEYLGSDLVQIRIKGGAKDIENYISYLETFPRTLDIYSISYSSSDLNSADEIENYQPFECRLGMRVFKWTGGEEED